MFETGATIEFTAQHQMPGDAGPEGELHEHDYRVEVVAERAQLDEHGMVCNLDILVATLQGIEATLAGNNVDLIKPADSEAVTVEVFAQWVHGTVCGALDGSDVDRVSVRVWESPTAFGGFSGPLD